MDAPNESKSEIVTESTDKDETQTTEDDRKEREHFIRIINAFKYYRTFSIRRVQQSEKNYQSLSQAHRDHIPSFLDHLDIVRACIDHNYEIIKLIIKDAENVFENKKVEEIEDPPTKPLMPLVSDMDKIKTTLKQFVRDWSESGRREREVSYDPVIAEIKNRFPASSCDPSSVSVLVPGAGLGRLAYEVAKLGYSCQGNEWSLFMLFASNFVLNKCHNVNSFTIYPWIHQWTNNMRSADQIEPIKFPDVDPSDLPPNVNFSMAAGDFMEVYHEPDLWDCLATVFFIDTAHNIIAYIETIYKILRPGGIWINLGPLLYHYADVPMEMSIELSYEEVRNVIGPLLYHYADMPMEMSIELSYEEVRNVIVKTGFVIEKEETDVKTMYTQNPNSMLKYTYDSVLFVARKPS